MRDLTEMNKLEAYLKEHGYEYTREDRDEKSEVCPEMDVHQIVVYWGGQRQWDVICHYGSYGCQNGLLEMMDNTGKYITNKNGIEGWLTADEIIRRLEGRP